jgi:hypothetical protein
MRNVVMMLSIVRPFLLRCPAQPARDDGYAAAVREHRTSAPNFYHRRGVVRHDNKDDVRRHWLAKMSRTVRVHDR